MTVLSEGALSVVVWWIAAGLVVVFVSRKTHPSVRLSSLAWAVFLVPATAAVVIDLWSANWSLGRFADSPADGGEQLAFHQLAMCWVALALVAALTVLVIGRLVGRRLHRS